MNKFVTATKARKGFYAMIEATQKPGMFVTIVHNGLPKAVMMSFEEFEGWQETMDIMADPDRSLDRDIRAGIKEMKSGKRPKDTISLEAFRKELKL